MVITHNMSAMNTQRQFGMVGIQKKKTAEKLASGYKVNRAADDAAGLTISENMRRQIRGLNQASDNIQDGISLVQIADGALTEDHEILQRMNELTIQAANGTNTEADRSAIQQEINELVVELDRIANSTTFNEKIYPLNHGPAEEEPLQRRVKVGADGLANGKYDGYSLENGTLTITGNDNYIIGPLNIDKIVINSNAGVTLVNNLSDYPAELTVAAGKNATLWVELLPDEYDTTAIDSNTKHVGSVLLKDGSSLSVKQHDNWWLLPNYIDMGNITMESNTTLSFENNACAYAYTLTKASGATNTTLKLNHSELFVCDGDHWNNNPIEVDQIRLDYAQTDGVGYTVLFAADDITADTKIIYPKHDDQTIMDEWDYPRGTWNDYNEAGRIIRYYRPFGTDSIGPDDIWIQAGAEAGQGFMLHTVDARAGALGVSHISVMSQEEAGETIDIVKGAIDKVSSYRSYFGAMQNRMEHAMAIDDNIAENTQAAESRVRDTDMAKEMVDFAKQNILEQVGTSMLAQANQSTQGVMQLLM